jgi:HTH-type transcriptional regulator / antitoxin HigA
MAETNFLYVPSSVSPPGDTLSETLEERGLTQTELARRMSRPVNAINEIVLGVKEITQDTAIELERVLGIPAHFWLARESRYREHLARERDAAKTQDRMSWLESLPLKALQDSGHLPAGRLTNAFKATLMEPALRFFGVASPEGWEQQYSRVQAAFRRANPTKQTDNPAITAWLRLGELAAEKVQTPSYNAETLLQLLPSMRSLSTSSAAMIGQQLPLLCAQAGVVLVFVPPLPGTHVSGVARWLGERPLVQLSLLGKFNDLFWFSFFHEIAHILKHPKRAVFLDDASSGELAGSPEEKEANAFAADTLIPAKARSQLQSMQATFPNVRSFARQQGIHAGIVVGCMQHLKLIEFGHPLHQLRERYALSKPA